MRESVVIICTCGSAEPAVGYVIRASLSPPAPSLPCSSAPLLPRSPARLLVPADQRHGQRIAAGRGGHLRAQLRVVGVYPEGVAQVAAGRRRRLRHASGPVRPDDLRAARPPPGGKVSRRRCSLPHHGAARPASEPARRDSLRAAFAGRSSCGVDRCAAWRRTAARRSRAATLGLQPVHPPPGAGCVRRARLRIGAPDRWRGAARPLPSHPKQQTHDRIHPAAEDSAHNIEPGRDVAQHEKPHQEDRPVGLQRRQHPGALFAHKPVQHAAAVERREGDQVEQAQRHVDAHEHQEEVRHAGRDVL